MLQKYANQIIVLSVVMLLALSLVFIRSCGIKRTGKNSGGECAQEGQVRQVECEAGESGRVFQICKSRKWLESYRECGPACSKVAFETSVKPLITGKCQSCHPGFDEFATAKQKVNDFIARVNLEPNSPNRMPKAPNPPLTDSEKKIFGDWKDQGLLEACPDSASNNNPHIRLDDIETAILKDLNSLSTADQRDSRYLTIAHKSDERANQDMLNEFVRASNKSFNEISFAREIVVGQPIDEYKTIFRFSLRDLKLSAADWKLIEDREPINIDSQTTTGLVLKQLTGARKPFLHTDSFAFTTNQPDVYYALRKLPASLYLLFDQLGVDFDGEQDNFTALFIGFADSPIALNKNRLLVRVDSNEGEVYQTFDVDQNKLNDARNLFKFPLLKPSVGQGFVHDASEIIGTIANGLHFYYLANAAGQRQNSAPITVVRDTASPFSSEITNSISCTRCHNGGYITADDEIRNHVDLNAAQFKLEDVLRVDALYRDPAKTFEDDNNRYAVALAKMGIAAGDRDPINLASDNLRRNMNAKSVAALLFLTEQEFLDGLARSPQGRQEIGTLLTGGSINFGQLVEILPDLLRDLQIGSPPFP